MKAMRIVLVLICLSLATMASGCTKVYFYSFSEEQDFYNDEGEWYLYIFPEGSYGFTTAGVTLDHGSIASPLEFSGDFTYTVAFSLNVNPSHVCNLNIDLTDFTGVQHDNGLHFEFYMIGNPSEEAYIIHDHSPFNGADEEHVNSHEQIPGIKRSGVNTFKMVKKGEHIRATINGTVLADFDLRYYDTEWFNPAISADLMGENSLDYGFTLQSVRVVYNGETQFRDMW